MNESKTLAKLRELEEEVEAMRRAFQAVLFGDAVEAEEAGRPALIDQTGSLDYDDCHASLDDPANARLRRVIDRAQQILAEASPKPAREKT